ncbi:MAG: cation:proton antiporter [Thermoguttaceae bacterium]|nr:cation:proton antiporter [Thermoguttaceae bacterium]
MITSLALIFLVGTLFAALCQKMGAPGIIGTLLAGVVLGPSALNLFDESTLSVSPELRRMALAIILIKAGLSLNRNDLKKTGRFAAALAFLPALCETSAFLLFAPKLLGVNLLDAAIIGAALSAVSPAIVVPRMTMLMEKKYGTRNGAPQMILAGASLDDVFVIALFTTFIGMAQGEGVNVASFANIPTSILSGLALGALVGCVLARGFKIADARPKPANGVVKTTLVLGTAFLLLGIEERAEGVVAISGLLAIMCMAFVFAERSVSSETARLRENFGALWIAAEVVLFALVGAAVDVRHTFAAGGAAILMIFVGLLFRSLGVLASLIGARLNWRERLFCVIAYAPKATVQAAIGGIPLALGLPCGKTTLSVAVLAILITAPLGALGIDWGCQKLLTRDEEE